MAEDGSHLSQRGKQILPRSNGQGSLRGLYKQDVQGKGSSSTPMHAVRSTGNKQEKLETILQQPNYYLVVSTET